MSNLSKDGLVKPYLKSCEILRGGPVYFEKILQLIREAIEVIHIQVYIFEDDATGNEVLQALKEATQRGVNIYVVLDGVGSGHLSNNFIKQFNDAGIRLRFFSKIRFNLPFRMGRRMHHKLLVVDSNKALVGGINFSDSYRGTESNLPWLDFGVYLEGAICIKLHNLAEKILKKRKFKNLFTKDTWNKNSLDKEDVRILENDFFKRKLQIRKSYLKSIKSSQSSLIIVASYFLPNNRILKQLENAAKRGVDIKLVFPRNSDVILYKSAQRYFYPRLIMKGIKIYEYPHSVLHAKVAASDQKWCTIGSYNLNDLSDLLSLELNIEILQKEIAMNFYQHLTLIAENECELISSSSVYNHPWIIRYFWRINYYILKNLLKLVYWLTDKGSSYPIA